MSLRTALNFRILHRPESLPKYFFQQPIIRIRNCNNNISTRLIYFTGLVNWLVNLTVFYNYNTDIMKVRGRQNYPDSKSIAGTVLPVKYLKGTFSLKRFLSRDNGQETFVTDPSVFQKSFSSSFSKRNFNFCSRQMSVRGKKEDQFFGVSQISFSRES